MSACNSRPESMQESTQSFVFGRDTLAFVNETKWVYQIDKDCNRQLTRQRDPVPEYALRCFLLVRVVKQFFLHARFESETNGQQLEEAEYRLKIRKVLRRTPRCRGLSTDPVIFPGYDGMYAFSRDFEKCLKEECGGAWQSYFQRGNWRMVLPIWRGHQNQVYNTLRQTLESGMPEAFHVFTFPQLTINHALLVYGINQDKEGMHFETYDPNSPHEPLKMFFDPAERQFILPQNDYFIGGKVNGYRVFCSWFY